MLRGGHIALVLVTGSLLIAAGAAGLLADPSPAREAPAPSASLLAHPTLVAMPRAGRRASRPRAGRGLRGPRLRGASGELAVVSGRSRRFGAGALRRFAVEVERGLGVDRSAFAAQVERALLDRRGWGGSGRFAFRRVDRGPVDFRVTLAGSRTVDRLCAPLATRGRYSCYMRGRAVLNLWRWTKGSPPYRDRRAAYRRYLVNHEVGHALGFGHRACPGPGQRAPVMMQQTSEVGACRPGWWPLPAERG